MLVGMTQVTRDNLQAVKGTLWALWATAQQINARQKVRTLHQVCFLHDKYPLES